MLASGLSYIRWLRQHCDGGGDILNYVVFDGLYIVSYCTKVVVQCGFHNDRIRVQKTFYISVISIIGLAVKYFL